MPIKKIALPYTFFCGIDSSTWAADFGKEIEDIAPKAAKIVGQLPSIKNNFYIIYGFVGDITYPYLYIYNKNGIFIDSLYLHINWCAGDNESIISNVTTINKDYSIDMLDSTKYVHFDSENVMYIDSVRIIQQRLGMDNEGLYIISERNEYTEPFYGIAVKKL